METSSTLLSWLIFSPLLFALVAFLSPSVFEGKLRKLTLVQTLVNALIATMVYFNFDGNSALPQMGHLIALLS